MNFADFAGIQMYLDSLVVILLVVPTEPFAATCAPRVTTVGSTSAVRTKAVNMMWRGLPMYPTMQ